MAELVCLWVWNEHGAQVQVDANYVAKLEAGRIRWPNPLYREALRSILGAGSDDELGFSPPHGVTGAIEVRGHPVAGSVPSGGIVESAVSFDRLALLKTTTPTAIPARIGMAEIEQIRTAALVFAGWDNTYGGGLAREAPLAQLRWSAGMLDAGYSPTLRCDLYSAVGLLAHTCGFMAFDDYAYDDARRVFRFGLACAEEADDWHLRSRLLASLARLEIWVGRPDVGLSLTERALVEADRLTASERAMLYCLQGRAYAKMERRADSLVAVGAADETFGDRVPAQDPPCMSHYDDAQHAGDIGVALLDLAIADRSLVPDAATRLKLATDERRSDLVRSRVLSQVNLAKLTMATGDPAEAVTIAHAVVDTAWMVRSRRVIDDLRDLRRHTVPHRRRADVAALRERLSAVLA